jgi:hypothetical protein
MRRLTKYYIVLIIFFTPYNLFAFEKVPEKSPDDVYTLTQAILDHMEQLKSIYLDKGIIKDIPPQSGRTPRHVLQKAYEILEKISKFREINKLGLITIPPYPNRPITPNEVYTLTARIHREIELLHESQGLKQHHDNLIPVKGKTLSDVYREMIKISVTLDSLMGIRGYTPSDVFALSERLLEEVRFLRKSQGLSIDVPTPKRTEGKHPNHALKASYDLLKKISTVQANLWLTPCSTRDVPMRIIIPNEVYDSVQENLAELQRIKYRLGLEYSPKVFPIKEKKSPDDVIYNLKWAKRLLPSFDTFSIKQRPRQSLIKTPNEVYALTQLIIDELEELRMKEKLPEFPEYKITLTNGEPKHFFIKAFECIKQVNHYRISRQNNKITLPDMPLRDITSNEVFDIMQRLYQEIRLLGNKSTQTLPLEKFTDKTPNDVYIKIWQISKMLDGILGEEGKYTPDDVFILAEEIIVNFDELRKHLGITSKIEDPVYKEGKKPTDTIKQAEKIIEQLKLLQKRAGVPPASLPKISTKDIRPEDVYNVAEIIIAEYISLASEIGLPEYISLASEIGMPDYYTGIDVSVKGKTPSDVLLKLEYAESQLESIINSYK